VCVALAGMWIAATPAIAQQKTVKACRDEWRANRAANQAKGITEKAYVGQCRTGGAATPPATPSAANAAPAPTPAAPPPAKPAAAPAPAPASAPARSATATPAGSNEFSSEGQAKATG
jgi:hypothetical protein